MAQPLHVLRVQTSLTPTPNTNGLGGAGSVRTAPLPLLLKRRLVPQKEDVSEVSDPVVETSRVAIDANSLRARRLVRHTLHRVRTWKADAGRAGGFSSWATK